MQRLCAPLLLLTCLLGCERGAGTPPPAAPNTQSVEGHGGIALGARPGAREEAPGLREPAAAASIDAGPPSGMKDLLLKAYTLREGDPARAEQLLRQVVDGTAADDPVHAAAARQLEALKAER